MSDKVLTVEGFAEEDTMWKRLGNSSGPLCAVGWINEVQILLLY
jgi:hypothetical protein